MPLELLGVPRIGYPHYQQTINASPCWRSMYWNRRSGAIFSWAREEQDPATVQTIDFGKLRLCCWARNLEELREV